MMIKHQSILKDSDKIPPIKHLDIPFSLGMSTQNEKPCPFKDELFRFADSNTVLHKIARQNSDAYLYLLLKTEQDCVLRATAAVTVQQPKTRRSSFVGSQNSSMDSSVAETRDNKRNSYDPSKKKAYIELLHKKDMQNVKFCALSQFGDILIEKKVRDRAIKDRIDAIKQSHNMKYKFDEEFT